MDIESDRNIYLGKYGAPTRTRTADLLITNQLLYQLSYRGTDASLAKAETGCNTPFEKILNYFVVRANSRTEAIPTAMIYSDAGAAWDRFSRLACS